jgi:hypothetical protein
VFIPAVSSLYNYLHSPEDDGRRDGRVRMGEEGKGKGREGEKPWHWHTKQRHMMKAEIEDAFRVRKWVVLFLLFCGGAVLVAVWVAVR